MKEKIKKHGAALLEPFFHLRRKRQGFPGYPGETEKQPALMPGSHDTPECDLPKAPFKNTEDEKYAGRKIRNRLPEGINEKNGVRSAGNRYTQDS